MTSDRFNTGQDYSFEWVWRYADAMIMRPLIMRPLIMWPMFVTQMSQMYLYFSRSRRYIETRYKASYHLGDMKRGFIL